MNISDILARYAREADPVCGVPDGMFYEQYDEAGGNLYYGTRGIGNYRSVPQTLQIWARREHCREWLYQRREIVDITPRWPREGYPLAVKDQPIQEIDDYDSALIFAVVAVGKDKA